MAKTESKPGLKVQSAFGDARIEITDGNKTVSVILKKEGVEMLVDELQTILDLNE